MDTQLVKVAAIKCLMCGDTIYSRTNHDFRWCSCGQCYVDGGPSIIYDDKDNNSRVGWTIKEETLDVVEIIEVESLATARDALFMDWNTDGNLYGLIKDPKYTEEDLIVAKAKLKLLEK